MNKKINELLHQAISDVDYIRDPIDNPIKEELAEMFIPDCFAERFAQLLVNECADIFYIDERSEIGNIRDRILNHFGVQP